MTESPPSQAPLADRRPAAADQTRPEGGARYAIPKESQAHPSEADPAGSRTGCLVSPGAGSPALRPAHRIHRARRIRQITVSYDDDEYTAIQTAARQAGLTPTGYVAEAAIATATDRDAPAADPARLLLAELMAARTQVRRFAVNVNQAVHQLNGTGDPPAWLDRSVDITTRAVERLDELALQISASLPGGRRP